MTNEVMKRTVVELDGFNDFNFLQLVSLFTTLVLE